MDIDGYVEPSVHARRAVAQKMRICNRRMAHGYFDLVPRRGVETA